MISEGAHHPPPAAAVRALLDAISDPPGRRFSSPAFSILIQSSWLPVQVNAGSGLRWIWRMPWRRYGEPLLSRVRILARTASAMDLRVGSSPPAENPGTSALADTVTVRSPLRAGRVE